MEPINFFKYDHSFCEAKLWGNAPEYVNSFTSLFISLVGLYGIKVNKHSNNYVFLLYSALIINGIMSFFYHWTNQIGWGILDRMSMVMIAIPAMYGSLKEISFFYNFSKSTEKLLLFLNQIYFTCLVTACGLGHEEIFNGLFGVFLASALVFIILIHNKRHKLNKETLKTLAYGKLGLFLIIIAGISWILIEKFCDRFDIMKHLHGHAVWHIFVSFGGYLLSLLMVGLFIERNNCLPTHKINLMHIETTEKKS